MDDVATAVTVADTSPHRRPSTDRAVARDVLLSFGLRAGLLPIAASAALLTAHLQVRALGVAGFALLSTVATLPLLLPLSDFGIGSAVTDSVSRLGLQDPRCIQVIRKALALLLAVGFAVVGMALIVLKLGLWDLVVSGADSTNSQWAITLVISAFGLGIPLGLGQRILLGLQYQRLITPVLSAGPVLACLLTLIVHWVGGASLLSMSCAAWAGPLAMQVLLSAIAIRKLVHTHRLERLEIVSDENAGSASLWAFAWGMTIISLVLPLIYQSGQILLNHLVEVEDVAQYSLAATAYSAAVSLVTLSGVALWPFFAQRRGSPDEQLAAHAMWVRRFLWVGLMLGAAFSVVGPSVERAILGTRDPNLLLWIGFGLLIVVMAVHQPSGMLLMDQDGLSYQSKLALATLAVFLPVCLFMIGLVGAAGPAVSAALVVSLTMVTPAYLRARLRRVS